MTYRSPILLAGVLALGACGGGGSSGSSQAAPPAPNQPPGAAFTTSPASGAAPLNVQFDAGSSTDPDGSLTRYLWDFGDGDSGEGVTTSHRYTAVGTYTASLTVTDDDGATATTSRVVEALELYAVSGTIAIQSASVMDSDTNDADAPRSTPNDGFATAQPIPTPATVGGYVTAAGATPNGAVSATGDPADVYRLEALGGERIVLTIADAGEDLDLRLYDASFTVVDASLAGESFDTEILDPIVTAGTYYVEVTPFASAASNYVLNIGTNLSGVSTAARDHGLRLSADFVPGEMLVGPPRSSAAPALPADLAVDRNHRLGSTRLARMTRPDAAGQALLPGAAPADADARAKLRTLYRIKHMTTAGHWKRVEPNHRRRSLLTPNDRFFPQQWHYDAVNLPQAWDLTTGDPSVVVAVIDSGILPGHPEFTGTGFTQLVDGYDFVSSAARSRDGDGIDPDPTDPGSGSGTPGDFHGTHVAGTIAARTDNGNVDGSSGGVAGVAWNTRLMPLRALGADGSGTTADILEALRYAGGLDNASGTGPAAPADVINLSIGGGAPSANEQALFEELFARGIIVVAAAGNDASSAPSYPAAYDRVISVAATTITDSPAPYSNFGATIDVAAPGGNLLTDINGDGFDDGVFSTLGEDADGDPATEATPRLGTLQGTSMAAPHVAGIAALMKAVYPGLTALEFSTLLESGALTTDLGAAGRDDQYGNGLVDAQRAVVAAVAAAGGDAGVAALLVASPRRLNFGTFTDRLEFRLANAGNAGLTASAPVPDAPWLSVTPLEVDASGLGTFEARVDRGLLPGDGIFSAGLRVDSDANAIDLGAQVQRSSGDLQADAGHTYLLLTTPAPDPETVAFASVVAIDGSYRFTVTDVPPGTYELVAGSDSDNDGFVGDPGESYGAYRTIDSPTLITVDRNLDDIDFVTGFLSRIAGGQATGTEATLTAPRRLPPRPPED